MRDYKIICPYCFKEFSHKDVHFRMETYFDENNLNEKGLTINEIMKLPDTPENLALKITTKNRAYFLSKDDPKYMAFWEKYGATTEVASGADRDLECEVYQLPVLDPSNKNDQDALKELHHDAVGAERFLTYDPDGMVVAVEDIFGRQTKRRVCPFCHNPLPFQYGKNPVKFISVIGVTSSGKTVYISQLLRHISLYSANASMVANIMSDHEATFLENNRIEMNYPLPDATDAGRLEQPMFYDLLQSGRDGRIIRNNIVIFDIAGETFKNAIDLNKYGEFVTRSDGIIFLVDPKQLHLVVGEMEYDAEPASVLQTMHQAFVGDNSNTQCQIPIAVCVSKSDIFAPNNIDIACEDVSPVKDGMGEILPLFNASEYNKLQPQIKRMIIHTLENQLKIEYANYNYFTISATGCEIEEREENGKKAYYLTAPPSPKRIAEPLLWLFHQFGYIKSDVPVILPHPRPETKIFVGYEKRSVIDVLLGRPARETWREMNAEEKRALQYEPAGMAVKPIG